ncbi:MAG: hypothetical protein H0T76_27875 [Nannocystis sp.]|nr:hypothetical protein [Nannocystis sp.]MBA3550312.1 hypothetical protein [Nannocystis sp.]
MAKGYIIEEIRASVRLRDPESGKSIEVPLETGGHWTPAPARGEHVPRSEPARREDRAPKAPDAPAMKAADAMRAPKPEAPKVADTTRAAKPEAPKAAEEPVKRRKPRSDKAQRGKTNARKSPRTGEAAEQKPGDEVSLASPEVRTRRVDMQHLSSEDADAWAKLQADLRHMRGRQGGKKGGLGWKETTDAGRSGLIARSGNGAYKILHAGADTYGLFYEWDNGTYERLACGRAEDLMNLATEQAQDGPPAPPPTKLSLELARLVCGNAEQKASAAERLEPVFREVDVSPDAEPVIEDKPEPRTRRAKEAANDEVPAAPAMAVDPAMDQQLVESLKKALAELEE